MTPQKNYIIIIGSFVAVVLVLVAIGASLIPRIAPERPIEPEPSFSGALLTESAARTIAERTCIKGGETLSPGMYNDYTKTWWFDANLNATQPGCNPACVVSEETMTAEINWRCTGLITPDEEPLGNEPVIPPVLPPDNDAAASLVGKTWVLVDGQTFEGTKFLPVRVEAFTLTFDASGNVSIGTDCNSMGGPYTASGTGLSFGNLFSTLMYCEGSSETEFAQILSYTSTYNFLGDMLILADPSSGTYLRFR